MGRSRPWRNRPRAAGLISEPATRSIGPVVRRFFRGSTMKHISGLAALAVGAFLASQAMAYQIKDGGITAPEVAKVLQDKGYKAEITTDDEGDPKVKSA